MDIKEQNITNWNPYNPDYFENPHRHLLDCQLTNPIQESFNKFIVLFKHKHIKEALRHDEYITTGLSAFLKSKEPIIFKNSGGCPFLAKSTQKWLMYLDGQEHNDARSFLEKALNRFNYEKIVEEAINEAIAELNFDNSSEFDLVDLSANFPILIINKIIGISSEIPLKKLKDVAHSLSNSQDMFVSIPMYLEINKDMEWLFEFFSELYDAAETKPNDSFISYLIEINQHQSNKFNKHEIISMLILLFGAVETSKDSISMIFNELLKNRALIQILKKGEKIERNLLIEEFLRFISPVQYTIRENTTEFEIEGKIIPVNSKLLLCLASANRDIEVFNNANEIVPDRKSNPHLAFGSGIHSCLGAKLARIELRQFLPKIAPLIEKLDFHPQHQPIWQKTIMMRGLKSLMVVKN